MKFPSLAAMFALYVMVGTLSAQDKEQYSRKNTFTIFAEDSKDSTPIIVGLSRQRKIIDLGGAYTRRVVRFHGSDLSYHIEIRPVLFESDPLVLYTDSTTYTTGPNIGKTFAASGSFVPIRCAPSSTSGSILPGPYNVGFTYVLTERCGRQWTFGQSFAPIGFKYAVRTNHPIQPFLIGTLGYMFTSRPVPFPDAEAFNFVINVGAGVEVFQSKKHSVALEASVQHFSNRNTAPDNPGTDNLMFKVSYSFGK